MKNTTIHKSSVKTTGINLSRILPVLFFTLVISNASIAQVSVTSGTTSNGYTLNSGTIYVDPAITITSSSTISGFKVTISSGLQSSDVLSYTGSLPSGVAATAYNSGTGVLAFTGSTSGANWQALMQTVTYKNLNTAQYGNRSITFSAGTSSAFSNGHFYELINGSTMSWTAAKAAAAGKSYLGYGGYLATITTSAENAFIKQVLGADAWIGASDSYTEINTATGTSTYANQAASEGKWYWVTGPEKGTLFSVGNNSPVTQSGQFAYWNSGEPNNSGGSENFGEIYSSGTGQWNDLGSGSNLGYVVEYGGLSTDPVQTISSNTSIYTLISTNTATAAQSICYSSTAATLAGSTATGGNGTYTYTWLSSTSSATSGYGTATGTSNTSSYSPGSLTTSTWYRRVVTSGALTDTTAAIAITVNPQLTSTSSQTNVLCNAGSTGTATVNPSGGTTAYTYLWSGGGTASTKNNLTAGNYTCTITDAASCSITNSFTITQPTVLAASTSQTNVPCNGASNGTASVNVSGGTSAYTYAWSPSGGTGSSASSLTAGNYTCSISDANGCALTKTFTLTQPSALTATSSQTNPSCNGGSNGTATVSVSGGTAAYTYSWSPLGGAGATASGLFAFNYTCTFTDANGCTNSKSFTITQPSGFGVANSLANVSCNGGSNGSATVIVSGATSPYTYLWSGGGTTATKNNLSAGNYTCSITDANGCTTTKNVTISQPATLSLNASGYNVSCNGGSNGHALTAVGGGTSPYTYLWSNGGTNGSAINLIAGNYTCTVTDGNGCTNSKSVSISEPTAVVVSSTQNNVLCHGGTSGSVQLSSSGGTSPYTYFWNNSSTNSSLSSLTAGTYTCTVLDANSCIKTNSYTITEPTALTASSSQTNVSCNGNANGSATISPSGGTSPYIYNWSTSETTATINNLSGASYSVDITDANGCTLSQSITISEPLTLTATPSAQDASCDYSSDGIASVVASGGTAPYSYAWSSGGTADTETGLSQGNYTVTITDDKGCSYSTSVTINAPDPIQANATTSDVSCNGGSNGTASVNPNGGTGTYTYLWDGGSTSNFVTGLSATVYSYTITDANGCQLTDQVIIDEPVVLAATTSTINTNCNASADGSANVVTTGGTTPYSYSWSSGGTTDTETGLTAGTYTVTITDANGCDYVLNANVGEPTAIVSNSTTTSVTCNGLSDGSATVNPSGGTGSYTYLWADGQTQSSDNGLSAQSIDVTITDNNGCNLTETITVSQPDPITAGFNAVDVKCNGGADGSATVIGSGGTLPYTYSWSSGGSTDTELNLSAGNYSITITDNNGCILNTSVTVNEPAALNLSSSQTNITCNSFANGTATVVVGGGSSPYNYNWSNGDVTDVATGLDAQTYSVIITDVNGCTITNSVQITQPDGLTLVSGGINPLCYGSDNGSANVVASGGTSPYTYAWSSGGNSDTENNLSSGVYTILVSDNNGCPLATSTVTLTDPAAINLSVSATEANCGQSNGTATVIASGGTGLYIYNWSSGGSNDTENNLSAGSYTVTVTDANGCLTNSIAYVSNIGAPTVSFSQTNNLCYGETSGTINLNVSGGVGNYSYSWSNGSTNANQSGLSANIYSYIVVDSLNCQSIGAVTITQPDSIGITSTTVNETMGNDGSINITVVGGTSPYQYQWSNGTSAEDPSGLAGGIYTVTVTDNNGCSNSVTVVVNSSVGINNPEANLASLIIYPNPSKGTSILKGSKEGDYSISDELGQVIQIIHLSAVNNFSVKLNDYANGIYYIKMINKNNQLTKKFVVIN